MSGGAGRSGEGAGGVEDDTRLLGRARRGDEAAFTALVNRHTAAMLRFARLHAEDEALAEDVVQDAWLRFVRGLDRFEGRASVRTWLYRILLNRLRTRLARERRSVPFSWLTPELAGEAAVDPHRFLDEDHPRWPHHWKVPPGSWGEDPEQRVAAAEIRELVERCIAGLPPAQRQVITLRDVEGWTSREVCELLRLSAGNERVLLHRARSRVRRALERHFTPERTADAGDE